jgi:serine/threonine-protein kinase
VLYFADESKDGSLRFLADGLTESLINELSRVPALDVVSRNGVRPFRGQDYDAVKDSVQRTLKIGSVVRGEVEPSAKGANVTVRLVDAVTGKEFNSARFPVDTANTTAAQAELSRRVSDLLRTYVGEQVKLRESRVGTSSSEAWTIVQRAEKRRKDADSLIAAGLTTPALQLLTEADAQLARAEQLDRKWVEPPVSRAAIAYERARAAKGQPTLAAAAIDSGMVYADRALAIDARSADALELRGRLQFQRIDQRLVLEGPEWKRLLAGAERDLSAAVEVNPAQAGAWATRSRVAYKNLDVQLGLLYAQNAYKADAYLSNAREILGRLFWTSFNLEAFPNADQWCAEGRKRFPTDAQFVECQLWMLTTKYKSPDVDAAWRLVDTLKALSPAATWEYEGRMGQILTAGVIAKAVWADSANGLTTHARTLADSAKRVLVRARATPAIDPSRELMGNEIVVRLFLKDYDVAMDLLASYLTANPDHRKGLATNTSPWWRDPAVQSHPRFRALIAGAK